MANIGNLSLVISANATKLLSGLNAATRGVQNFARATNIGNVARSILSGGGILGAVNAVSEGVQNLLGKIPYIGSTLSAAFGLATEAATTAFRFYQEGAAQIIDVWKASQRLGISTETLTAIQYASGTSAEAVQRAMFKLGQNLGAVATESEEAISKFRKLGLDGKELAKLPLDQALGKIADKFNTFGSSGEKAFFVFQLFGKLGAEIIPVLARGSAGLEAARRKVQQLGLSFSAVDGAQVQKASLALKQVDFALDGIKRQIAVQLAPYIIAVADSFGDWAPKAATVAGYVVDGFKAIVYAGATAVEIWKGLGLIWDATTMGFKGFAAYAGEAMLYVLEIVDEAAKKTAKLALILSKLTPAGRLAIGELKEQGFDLEKVAFFGLPGLDTGKIAQMRNGLKVLWDDIADDREEFLFNWENDTSAVKSAEAFFKKIEDAVKKAKGALNGLGAPDAGLLRLFEVLDKGAKFTKENGTPLNKFHEQLKDLNEMVNAGAISWGVYTAAVTRAMGDAEKTLGLLDHKSTAALEEGSSAAISALIKADSEANRGNPQERIENLLAQSKEIQKRQEQQGAELVAAFRGLFPRGI